VDAGRQLARCLGHLRGPDLVVLGLPRGGVVVAAEVAQALHAPLDVLVVRKLGHPSRPELALGAVGEEGVRVLAPGWSQGGVDERALEAVERRESEVLRQRVDRLRRNHARVELTGKVALVVDDGIATGSTVRAACRVARALGAARVVVGAPVAPASVVRQLVEADEVICVMNPPRFQAVGLHYRDFSQTEEDEVSALLVLAAQRRPSFHVTPPSGGGGRPGSSC
jgi:putative phosphoribosyl transferase